MKRGLCIVLFFIAVLSDNGIRAQETSPYAISRLSFNLQGFSEISPIIVQDGIMFCSDRRLSGVTDRTSFDDRRLYSIYIAEKKDTIDWRKPIPVKSDRTAQFNTGPMCIAPDRKTVYFTSEIETGVPSRSRKFRNRSGIFTAELNGLELLSIKPFKFNSLQYDIGQPSLSTDGKFLYFASDMPGGQGGSDIWFCESLNGEWSTPVNLGSKVNSPVTDNYPFIHPSGKLYFASNRPGGAGGLDVYYSDFVGGAWETPIRLAEQINSPYDDFAFAARPDLQKGYFSSNRRRNDDIYEFTATTIRKTSCNQLEINNFCYEFVEENAVKYDSIPFKFEWKFGDGNKAIGRIVEHCYTRPGKYLVQLDVTNLVTKKVSVNEKSEILEIQNVEQPYISCPNLADADAILKFSADSTYLPGWDISQYYWNFGDGTFEIGRNVEKTFNHPGTYNVQLVVSTKPEQGGMVREACVSKNITIKRNP